MKDMKFLSEDYEKGEGTPILPEAPLKGIYKMELYVLCSALKNTVGRHLKFSSIPACACF